MEAVQATTDGRRPKKKRSKIHREAPAWSEDREASERLQGLSHR